MGRRVPALIFSTPLHFRRSTSPLAITVQSTMPGSWLGPSAEPLEGRQMAAPALSPVLSRSLARRFARRDTEDVGIVDHLIPRGLRDPPSVVY